MAFTSTLYRDNDPLRAIMSGTMICSRLNSLRGQPANSDKARSIIGFPELTLWPRTGEKKKRKKKALKADILTFYRLILSLVLFPVLQIYSLGYGIVTLEGCLGGSSRGCP